jgi:hypothetical protein
MAAVHVQQSTSNPERKPCITSALPVHHQCIFSAQTDFRGRNRWIW